jgi:glucose-1-phosphate cytidylyltransferase
MVEATKAVILAGGFGTRISEESSVRPKPMVEIGGRPILWHIMKIYSAHGIREFLILAGYKGQVIKEFFANYALHTSDVSFDLSTNSVEFHSSSTEPWRVTIVDTGESTLTGGRLLRARAHIGAERFFLAYGDCVSNVDLRALLAFHVANDALVTLTAVQPPGRFGALTLRADSATVTAFHEKPLGDGAWANGGFFVVEPEALDRIPAEAEPWEGAPLEQIAGEGRLAAYRHSGYWQNLDTLRDKMVLEQQWADSPQWKIW